MLETVSGMKPKISLFIQARLGSTRLPSKVLSLLEEKPLILHLIERLQYVQKAHHIALLAPLDTSNDPLVSCVSRATPIDIFRGSEEDVLSRFYEAALTFHPNIIVRITADCPLIDPKIIDAAIDLFLGQKGCTYVSTKGFPRGLDVEVFSFHALQSAFHTATDPSEREHVTLHFYRHPKNFPQAYLISPYNLSHLRITVDELDDLKTVKAVYRELKGIPNFGLKELYQLSLKKADLFLLNAHVQQKPVSLSTEAQVGIENASKSVYLLR